MATNQTPQPAGTRPRFANHPTEATFWLSTRDRADCRECAGHGCTFCYQSGKQLTREDILLLDAQPAQVEACRFCDDSGVLCTHEGDIIGPCSCVEPDGEEHSDGFKPYSSESMANVMREGH